MLYRRATSNTPPLCPTLGHTRTLAYGLTVGLSCTLAFGTTVLADVRATGMGGTAVSVGSGHYGALANPALLLTPENGKTTKHIGFGVNAVARDRPDLLGIATDEANQELFNDIDTEINAVTAQPIICDPVFGSGDDACVQGTGALASLADRVQTIFEDIDEEPVEGQVRGNIGFSNAIYKVPFLFDYSFSATGFGEADILEADSDYVQILENTLEDNQLTLNEIIENAPIRISNNGSALEIDFPDDVLTSEGSTAVMLRNQFSLGFAKQFSMGNNTVAVGVTPKFSTLTAQSSSVAVKDLSEDELADDLEASEVSESSFTFDVGASMPVPGKPAFRVAGVIRNVISESITTLNGFEFETTPQLIVGGHYKRDNLLLSADLALNEASYDGFDTQPLSLGLEYKAGPAKLRAGINNDFAFSSSPTSFSVGLGLGAFDIAYSGSGGVYSGGVQFDINW